MAADLHTDDEQNYGEDHHDAAVTDVANVDQNDQVTNPSLSYLKDIGNMTITQSAKSMLDMLDDLSMSEGLHSDISHFEPDVSDRTNRFKPEIKANKLITKTGNRKFVTASTASVRTLATCLTASTRRLTA